MSCEQMWESVRRQVKIEAICQQPKAKAKGNKNNAYLARSGNCQPRHHKSTKPVVAPSFSHTTRDFTRKRCTYMGNGCQQSLPLSSSSSSFLQLGSMCLLMMNDDAVRRLRVSFALNSSSTHDVKMSVAASKWSTSSSNVRRQTK